MKKKEKNKNSSVFLEQDKEKVEDEVLNEDIAQSIEMVNRNREELDHQRTERINKFERTASGQMILRPKAKYKIDYKLIIGIVAGLIIFTWLLNCYGPILGIHITGKANTPVDENKIELVTKDSDIYGMYDEELFVYSNNTITTYNEKGEVTWTYTFSDSFIPNIVVNGNYLVVTNNSTGMVYLFENRKEILNKKVDGIIKNAFVDEYGDFAIEYSNISGYNNVVSVFDRKGRDKYDAYLSQENIIDLKMLNNADQLIFTESITNSASIGVRFRLIDIDKKEEEQLRDIVELDNQVVYNFVVQGKVIYALLDNKIVSIDINDGDVETLKEFDGSQMIFVALNDRYFTYLERNISGGNYSIVNQNYNKMIISQTEIDSVPKSMVSSEFVNYYMYQDHIYILNKWGVELKQRDINFTPKKCIVYNDNKTVALIYTNKIYILNI